MTPGETFQALCAAPKLEEALRQRDDATLARLITWLRAGHAGGIAGLVLGVAELEAVERFTRMNTPA